MTSEERVRLATDQMNKNAKRMFGILENMPDVPPCSKCGRVIYCGVNRLCSEADCPKKTK